VGDYLLIFSVIALCCRHVGNIFFTLGQFCIDLFDQFRIIGPIQFVLVHIPEQLLIVSQLIDQPVVNKAVVGIKVLGSRNTFVSCKLDPRFSI